MAESRKPTAIVLASGGLDSCVTVAIAAVDRTVALMHVSYGQRTAERESRAFLEICKHYKVPQALQFTTSLDHLRRVGGSSLTDESIPVSAPNLISQEIPTSYVPFRNAHLLVTAVSWAEGIGATSVFIGAVEEDSSGYPDCRRSFFDAFQIAIERGTRPETRIELLTPLIEMSKSEIIETGIRLGAPLHLTWSCYQNSDKACGVCDSCALRLRAFHQAGLTDPIPYEKRPQYT